jgi:hypothetical protein
MKGGSTPKAASPLDEIYWVVRLPLVKAFVMA